MGRQWGSGGQGCHGASAGRGEQSWWHKRKPCRGLSGAGKPAVHSIAVQAGHVCLQRFARQRQPERRRPSHSRHHEQEPHRWVPAAWHRLCPQSRSPWKHQGSCRGGSGWGLRLWVGEVSTPALPRLQVAAKGDGLKQWLRLPWQGGYPTGCRARPHSYQNPDPEGGVVERRPQVLYFCISMGHLFLS